MDREALLVRYETLAANRRHFEALFFAVTAFSCSFGLASWAAVTILAAIPGAALLATGAILSGGAFIAHRLMQRERSSYDAMASTWNRIAGHAVVEGRSRVRPGAMAIAVSGQGLAGLVLVVAGALTL